MERSVGHLFWKYVARTPLINKWDGDTLADHLATLGVIRIVVRPLHPMKGVATRRYFRVNPGYDLEAAINALHGAGVV